MGRNSYFGCNTVINIKKERNLQKSRNRKKAKENKKVRLKALPEPKGKKLIQELENFYQSALYYASTAKGTCPTPPKIIEDYFRKSGKKFDYCDIVKWVESHKTFRQDKKKILSDRRKAQK